MNVDRRGWYGAPVAAVTGAAAGWPSWLRSFRELRGVRSARRLDADATGDQRSCSGTVCSLMLVGELRWTWGFLGRWRLISVAERASKFETVFRKMGHRWEQDVLQAHRLFSAFRAGSAIGFVTRLVERVVYLPNGACSALGDARRGRRILVFLSNGDHWICGLRSSLAL